MIKVGIVGYGNLGKASEKAVMARKDMQLVAVFSKRKVDTISGVPAISYDDIKSYVGKIDIMLLCGGSATNLREQSVEVAKYFNTADSFDTHAIMREHFDELDKIQRERGGISLIATGWDPGLFSMMRVLFEGVMADGDTYTFWGKGVSQGHSEAIRRIPGVKYGVQYTVPKDDAINSILAGNRPVLSTRDKHARVCYIVLDDGADKDKITENIVNMPNYFADYDTTVNFISEEEFLRDHTSMPHGGLVLRSGDVNGVHANMNFELKLKSNPDFTANVLVTFARATMKLKEQGKIGAVTVFDIPLGMISDKSGIELVEKML